MASTSPSRNIDSNTVSEALASYLAAEKKYELLVPGTALQVISGPFTDFTGMLEEVDSETGKLKVSLSIFGKTTFVEFDVGEVIKLEY
ncbi:uncharacterized protein LOC141724078 [Apium graveolens]|uniref:uncharacterized protein LOC141724078 n=1 Tax=Apium graveolens TaxID=4045 RepID=UPI003D7B9ADA